MYSNIIDLELNSYINCLWNYFQSYNKSINKYINNQESKWLIVLERSKLNMNKKTIKSLIQDPNNIFKITKYKDISLNQIQLLKMRFFIVLNWLNYLLLVENNNKDINIFKFDHYLLENWLTSIDSIISIFESRNDILISERDIIYNNLKELEHIKLKFPHLDDIHQKRLETQLKALRYILNLESSDNLRDLNNLLKELKSSNFDILRQVPDNIETVKKNFKNFLNLFEHTSHELLSKYETLHIHIFDIRNNEYNKFIESNLKLKKDLTKYRDIIYNTKSLSWSSLDYIKILEMRVNLKNITISNLLISKSDKVCNLSYNIILENNSNIFSDDNLNTFVTLQKNILSSIDSLKKIKEKNYMVISNLEKDFNYSDLKGIDIDFYYQYLTHLNTIIYGITNGKEININTKKYLSNEIFTDRRKFNNLVKSLRNQFVNKNDFNNKINEIETRITNIEENKPAYILGTMVISLISLFVWKRMINFKKQHL